MAKKKEEQKKFEVGTERKDHTKTILIVFGLIAVILIVIGILNLVAIIDTPIKQPKDTDGDGIYDVGIDTDNDGVIDRGESRTEVAADFFVFAILAFVGPYGFYASAQYSHVQGIEKRLPDFLRDVAEAGRFGMTLADAIIVASSGRYGPLTPEIKKMAAQVEWGVPVSEALRLFTERVNTPLVNRVSAIIIKSSDAGGSVADVLTMVAHDTKEVQLVQEERKISMSTYIAVIYIAFFVFLATILILNNTFLPKMAEAGASVQERAASAGGGAAGGVSIEVSSIPQISFAFFIAAVVHAVGDGILAGVLENGKIVTGLRHSFIMLVIGFMLLKFT